MDGGAEGDRTPDLSSAIAALSQLSYGPRIVRHLGIGLPACQGSPAPAIGVALIVASPRDDASARRGLWLH